MSERHADVCLFFIETWRNNSQRQERARKLPLFDIPPDMYKFYLSVRNSTLVYQY